MKNISRILFVLVAFSFAACKQKATPNNSAVSAENAPVIKFEKEMYAFGKITEGEKVHYDFKFTNTGKSPLIITSATATCGCTIPEPPKEPINPGKQGVIKVIFDSKGKLGLNDKVITINSNANPPQSMVHLVGEVEPVNN